MATERNEIYVFCETIQIGPEKITKYWASTEPLTSRYDSLDRLVRRLKGELEIDPNINIVYEVAVTLATPANGDYEPLSEGDISAITQKLKE